MVTRIRVMNVIKGLGRGGAETLLPSALRSASRSEFDFSYAYLLPHKSDLAKELEALGSNVFCIDGSRSTQLPSTVLRLARLLKREAFDVVHAHLPIAGVVARTASVVAGVPFIYTEHNLLERYHPITRWANKATWSLQDHVVAVSDEVKSSIRRRIRSRVPISVVRNGVDANAYSFDEGLCSSTRRLLEIPNDAPVVGLIAVFRAQKRLDRWLEAAALIKSTIPDTRFVLVGDGPLRPDVESAIARLGLSSAVHLVGLQSDVRPYLACMDVFMMSSDFEGLPVAMLEAMAMRLPIVATSVGGISEAVTNGRDGFLTMQDSADLAGRAVALLRDETLRRTMGENARSTIVERFSIRAMQRSLEDLYRTIVSCP